MYETEEMSAEYYKKLPNFEIYYDFIELPFGKLLAGFNDGKLCFLSHSETENQTELSKISKIYPNCTLTHKQIEKIPENVTLLVKGTAFEVSVWKQLLKIPKGDLASYEDIAVGIGRPKSTRAVANSVGSNHIAFVIPCHRVIRKDGTIGGYSGAGIEKKLKILKYEGVDTSRFL